MSFLCAAVKRLLVSCLSLSLISAFAQQPSITPRITQRIDPTKLTRLTGSVHPLAQARFDQGSAPGSMLTNRMLLVLSRSEEQEKSLRQFLDEQQTPGSPNYHKWLTPEEFGQMFGPADEDVQTVATWLLNQGFQVERISAGKTAIEFSGTAGQLRQTFHTDLHKFVVNGKSNWANANDPEIPSALASVVKGFVSLNNFPRKNFAQSKGVFTRDMQTGKIKPLLTLSNGSENYYLLGPGDFSTIYNSKPLISAGTNGAGQTIAIVGQTNINLQDVTAFRNMFGLSNVPDNHTKVILNGPDPGINSDEMEAILDVEWSGAAAPGANIVLVASESTETTSGVDLSALYIVENNLASVMSESYGACERDMGNAGNQFVNSLWQQAAAQGITVLVSSGDSGSAGCDYAGYYDYATQGTAVNGLASTPYNVAVGGTDFNDVGTQSSYWSNNNTSGSWTSALGYVPEMTWNDSCAGGGSPTTASCTNSSNLQLWAASGGPSNCSTQDTSGNCVSGTAKPSWQSATGVPADGLRDIPDVSLFAASGSSGSNSFYVVCQSDVMQGYPCQISSSGTFFVGAAGTSASSPAFAGIVAIANQKLGKRLGNINYLLYQSASQTGVFHDVTKGGISVPCLGGTPNCSATSSSVKGVLIDNSGKLAYMTGTGYDMATGLGSVNVANLVTALATAEGRYTTTSTALTLNGGTTQVTAAHGSSISVGVSVTPTASSGSVSLIGNSQGFDSQTLSGGLANWNSTLFPGGNYSVQAHYAGDGSHKSSDSNTVAVSITPEASNTLVNLVTWDAQGNFQSYAATSAPYGSLYLLRMDVADTAATVSAADGVNSKCSTGKASCPTGKLTVTSNGNPLDGGTFALNNLGYTEDQRFFNLMPGTYNIATSYPGDSSYNANTATTALTVTKAPTELVTGAYTSGPYRYGTPFSIQGVVNTTSMGVAPTGTVTWQDNGAAANIQWSNSSSRAGGSQGFAQFTYSSQYVPTSLGDHTLVGQYGGDSNYASATNTAPFTITVGKASVKTYNYGVQPLVATPLVPVTLNVQFQSSSTLGAPTGTITFSDNGIPISGTVTYTSQVYFISATLTTTFSQLGQHVLTADYSGDSYNVSATQKIGTLNVSSQLSTSVQTTTGLIPAVINYPTPLIATVIIPSGYNLPVPTGTITFSENNQQLSGNVTYTQNWNGYGSYTLVATLPFTFTTAGTHSITATYSGDSVYTGSTSPALSQSVVDKLPTTITRLMADNLVLNVPTTLVANVDSPVAAAAPVISGTVTFFDGDTQIPGTPTYSITATHMAAYIPYTFASIGTHNVTVKYSGDTYYAAQSKVFTEDILGPLAVRFDSPSMTMGSGGGSNSTTVRIVNSTSNPMTVSLTCTPDSTKATCSLSNNSVVVYANNSNVQYLLFTVPALTAADQHQALFRMPLVFAGLLGGLGLTVGRKRRALFALMLLATLMLAAVSCGGGGSTTGGGGGGGGGGGTQPKVYKFTVKGTAGANTDSQVFTVTVQ